MYIPYAGAPTAARVSSFFPFVSMEIDVAFFRVFFCNIAVFSKCIESTSYVFFLPYGVFFYLVTKGWIFLHSLCENSIK